MTPADKFMSNYCGCGMPNETLRYIFSVLSIIEERSSAGLVRRTQLFRELDDHMGAGSGGNQFILYALDAAGLLEHGGSIGGAWLSDVGRELLEFLKTTKADKWLSENRLEDYAEAPPLRAQTFVRVAGIPYCLELNVPVDSIKETLKSLSPSFIRSTDDRYEQWLAQTATFGSWRVRKA
jgi:hypothetical protein